MDVIKKLCFESRTDQWSDGCQWLLWTFLTGLLPLWGTIILLRLLSQTLSVTAVMSNGEFSLYAASIAGAAIYLVMRDFKTTPFPSRISLMIVLVALVVLASLMFAGITSLALVDKVSDTKVAKLIDPQFVAAMSWALLPLAIFLGFFVVIADNIRTNPDPGRKQKENLDKLGKDFDQLEK